MEGNIDDIQREAAKLSSMFNDEPVNVDYKKLMSDYGLNLEMLENEIANYKPKLSLKYKKLHPDAFTPLYNYPSDSGFDLHSTEEIVIPPFGRVLVPTGLSFEMETGHEIQVRTKSGLALKQGLIVLNSPATIDSGYSGEIKVIIFNVNNTEVKITKGMKVAQAVYCPVANGEWINLEEVGELKDKDRGSNGFGSTGINN